VELDAVRTFVAVADLGQFQEAAAELAVTQQAVSKRIAALEAELGVRLFTRGARGARLTIDGQAFLAHARELLRMEERAMNSVRPGRRALRVDVVSRRVATGVLLQEFHRAHPEVELDVLTLDADAEGAIASVETGVIDATFHGLMDPPRQLPAGVAAARLLDEPHELMVGPRHALAGARTVTPAQLAGQRIWMPGLAGGEVSAYYVEFAAAFGLSIDVVGPVFGYEALLAEIADSAELTTLVGERSRYLWPDSYDLRRIPLRDPTPVYPMSLIWRRDNPHPALALLRAFVEAAQNKRDDGETWVPTWAECAQ
jgi:DNA-binding transcriptional LysR family regulator